MKLKKEQIPALVKLLERGQAKHHDSIPKIFPKKLENFFRSHLVDPKTLIVVNKNVTAVLVLMVVPDLFSYQQSVKDLVWYSQKPGEGIKLLKEAKKWIKGWGGSIHSAYLSTSLNDDRVERLIKKMGLTPIGTTYKFRGEE